MNNTTSTAMAEPPEGVLAGESIPRENTLDDQERALVERVANRMKVASNSWRAMGDAERKERVRVALTERGVL